MPFALTDEQVMLREVVRGISHKYVEPRAAAVDETAEFPWDHLEMFRKSGLLGLGIPERYGGTGAGVLALCIAVEEVAHCCASSSLILAIQELGMLPILVGGTEEQRTRWLPAMSRGDEIAAFGLTEPEAGSDPLSMHTTAVEDGGGWTLNGGKRFISNAGIADWYTVFAKTDPDAGTRALSCFMVHKNDQGFQVGRMEQKMGMHGSPTGDLIFDGCRLPADRLVGVRGEGFKYAMMTLDQSRTTVGAQALGIAQGALHAAAKYAVERKQFGKPIAEFQGLQFMLADMAMKVESARALLYEAADMVDALGAEDRGKERLPKAINTHSAMAKCICSDVAMSVTTDAVQIFGGYGYSREYPVERMMRDAKITQIYEGTNQIQRVVIARNLLEL